MDVPSVINNYKQPPPGWARIEVESVEVPLEPDESILLSSIQSVFPGAYGLYYKDGNSKVGLRYYNDRISKGRPGWTTQPIYVALAGSGYWRQSRRYTEKLQEENEILKQKIGELQKEVKTMKEVPRDVSIMFDMERALNEKDHEIQDLRNKIEKLQQQCNCLKENIELEDK